MEGVSFRTVLILVAFLVVFTSYCDACKDSPPPPPSRRRRYCSTQSCTWQWGSCSRTCGGGSQNPVKTRYAGSCGYCNMPSGSRSCNTHCCRVNCQWRSWSSWGSCTRTCGGGTQQRSRLKNRERCGGRTCSGSVVETRSCNRNCCPVHCVWASWRSWGSCSQTCGGGIQSRNRRHSTTASCGGNYCPGSSVDTRSCNQNCCPVNCVWNPWSNWDGCSRSCGSGTQARKRGYSIAASCGGAACSGNSNGRRSCNSQCCPVDCFWAPWAQWGDCSVSCGGGSQSRGRARTVAASCGGGACSGSSKEKRSCNRQCCPVDCSWAPWGQWGRCSATCGGGSQSRDRNRSVAASCGGTVCSGNSNERRSCNRQCCPVNCAWGPWSEWGVCSVSCGGGSQSRSREQSTAMSCAGTPCSGRSAESRACNDQCCPVNCAWAKWSNWGGCSRSCGGGTQARKRGFSVAASCGGTACSGNSNEQQSCNRQCCPVDCCWSPWAQWGECPVSCGGGSHSRGRSRTVAASCGGRACAGSSNQERACNSQCCPVDCSWAPWGRWDGCSVSCGGGSQSRGRKRSVAASCGGTICSGNSNEQRSCNRQCCPVNCAWGLWTGWGVCSVSCGGGSQSRDRGQSTAMSCGGAPCSGRPAEFRACNNQCCPVNCAWAKWSQWGSCSASCGGGTQVRQRGEDPVEECGGNSCVGSPNNQRICNAQCCPVDCVWGKWSDWDACTTTCGGGTQKRKRAISIPSFCAGNQCLGDKLEFQDCNSQCCPVDCKWGPWEDWGVCTKTCERGTQTRRREIAIEAFCDGSQCPGSYEDTRFCNDVCCPVHCQWGEWSRWSNCTKTCETGTQYRDRVVNIYDICGGDECNGPRREEQQCNTQCCPVDCVLTTWTHWTECSHTCGAQGSQNRHRNITKENFCGGKPCELNRFETRECNKFCFNNGSLATDACHCPDGWKGDCCQEDKNECEYVNCTQNSNCFNTVGSFECVCNDGYTKTVANCLDIDECHLQLHDCHKMAQCINLAGKYSCKCDPGFSGNGFKCADIDECAAESNYDRSGDDVSGYYGHYYYFPSLCHDEATCLNTYGGYNCCCNMGYVGDGVYCQDLDECKVLEAAQRFDFMNASNGQNGGNHALVPCDIHATCFNLPGTYGCRCEEGYFGDGISCKEINECDSDPCKNGGTCKDKVNAFLCNCSAGYAGLRCEMDKDECLFHAFQRSIEGSGEQETSGLYVEQGNASVCHDSATCINTFGSYFCTCNHGFVGDGFSCIDLDECAIDADVEASSGREDTSGFSSGITESTTSLGFKPCSENANCKNWIGYYTCTCKEGFRGDGFRCDDIHECKENRHLCDPKNAKCINTDGSHECICKYGFSGDGKTCFDLDECKIKLDDCNEETQLCLNQNGGFLCVCKDGYQMEDGECKDLDECAIDADVKASSGREDASGISSGITGYASFSIQACSKHAVCSNSIGDYSCACKEGYRGNGFSCVEVDECFSNPCKNGGICTDHVNGFRCQCGNGYTGANCEIDIHECKEKMHVCDPKNARCINTDGSHDCVCKYGYSGDGKICFDLDECKFGLDNCDKETQLCRNQDGGFLCVCKEGYEMKDGECKDTDECLSGTHNCKGSHQECRNKPGSYECGCKYPMLMKDGKCEEVLLFNDNSELSHDPSIKPEKQADSSLLQIFLKQPSILASAILTMILLVAIVVLVIKIYRRGTNAEVIPISNDTYRRNSIGSDQEETNAL